MLGVLLALTLLLGGSFSAFAQDTATPVPATADNSQPAPPSIGADIPLTYFGPVRSSLDPELVGPHQLLRSGTIDTTASTITLPLYQGKLTDGRAVWYVLTDTNDKGNADALGLNYSTKLTYAAVGQAVRTATLEKDATLTFEAGAVDFSPERSVVPGDGAKPFPPKTATPGSVGDADYSPRWNVNLGEWTQEAVDKGYRSRVTEEFQILGLVQQGWITGPGGTPYGSIGVVVNCPIVWRFL